MLFVPLKHSKPKNLFFKLGGGAGQLLKDLMREASRDFILPLICNFARSSMNN